MSQAPSALLTLAIGMRGWLPSLSRSALPKWRYLYPHGCARRANENRRDGPRGPQVGYFRGSGHTLADRNLTAKVRPSASTLDSNSSASVTAWVLRTWRNSPTTGSAPSPPKMTAFSQREVVVPARALYLSAARQADVSNRVIYVMWNTKPIQAVRQISGGPPLVLRSRFANQGVRNAQSPSRARQAIRPHDGFLAHAIRHSTDGIAFPPFLQISTCEPIQEIIHGPDPRQRDPCLYIHPPPCHLVPLHTIKQLR